jgi:hypothetical protein
MQRPLLTSIPLLAALGCVFAAALPSLVPALAPPASGQALPPCGSEQMEPRLENLPRLLYAGHTYQADLLFDERAGTRSYYQVNVQVTGPPGVVRSVSTSDGVKLSPQAAGTLALTVSWDQELYPEGPVCSASKALELQISEPLPLTIEPTRHGTRASVGVRRGGFAITFTLTPGELPPFHGYREVVDLTPVRVEARAVAGAKRPSRAVEPAVLEYVPGARRPRRAHMGLVTIVRREGYSVEEHGRESVEILVAAPLGLVRRGVSVTLTQGTRLIGSFAAAGRCHSSNSLGLISGVCDFKGKHDWLWAPCRRAVLIRGRFYGCYR